jgi:mRNA interferase RelE/StbE
MYSIEIKKSAQKELAQIPSPYNKKIVEAIDSLAEEPRPQNVKKLQGEQAYRIPVADYRIVYTMEDTIKVIEVQRICNRKDAYK